ncbi:MAG: recombinase family protein [Candidatus Moraniibacteriota bacterium]
MNNTTTQQLKEAGQGVQTVAEPAKIKYCLYARKSTESEERQVLSIDSQIKEMLQIAERDGLDIVEMRRESHSAKNSNERPVFNSIIKDIQGGKFNGIMTWAPDRLSRNAGDLGALVDLMDQKLLIEIRTFGQQFTNSPNEKFLLMILGSQAKLENDNRSVNVKRGLRTRVEMGLWPGVAPTGYLNEKMTDRKCQVIVDPERAPIIRQVFEKVAYEQWSGRKLYHWLRFEIHFTTRYGKPLALSNIYRMLQRPFYHGIYEYPEESGHWYTGKHKPIITKELFDKVQEQLNRDQIVRENREFAFTKMITCGLCGSGVTAQEKYKKQKNGNEHKYVYYGCTRAKDLNCKAGYVREDALIESLINLIDKIDLNELGLKNKFHEEVSRYNRFQRNVLKRPGNEKSESDIDLRVYAKYILREGSMVEKRELLSCLRSRLIFKDKGLTLEKANGK